MDCLSPPSVRGPLSKAAALYLAEGGKGTERLGGFVRGRESACVPNK